MITLRHYDRVMQIWLDELPEWCSEESEVAERHQETTKVFFTEACRAAVELFLPIGGRAHYGALGAEFVPGQQGRLLIQVPFSVSTRLSFSDRERCVFVVPLMGKLAPPPGSSKGLAAVS